MITNPCGKCVYWMVSNIRCTTFSLIWRQHRSLSKMHIHTHSLVLKWSLSFLSSLSRLKIHTVLFASFHTMIDWFKCHVSLLNSLPLAQLNVWLGDLLSSNPRSRPWRWFPEIYMDQAVCYANKIVKISGRCNHTAREKHDFFFPPFFLAAKLNRISFFLFPLKNKSKIKAKTHGISENYTDSPESSFFVFVKK